jgi:hypothetical protein
MATVSKTTANLEGIPPMLQRTNGQAKPSYEELLAQIAALQAQAAKRSALTLKVSEKGAVSIYGMGRFPVTLFGQQWLKVLDMADDIRSFIEANKDKLSWK